MNLMAYRYQIQKLRNTILDLESEINHLSEMLELDIQHEND